MNGVDEMDLPYTPVPANEHRHGPCRHPTTCGYEQCHVCQRYLSHDFVHWNGAFDQCEDCWKAERKLIERGDPRAGRDPIFGGYSPYFLRKALGKELPR